MNDCESDARFERLFEYHRHDPANVGLAVECAEAALAADRPVVALEVLERLPPEKRLEAAVVNLIGIAAMRSGNQEVAQACFRSLLEDSPDEPSLRLNLAWSLALGGDKDEASRLLDDATIVALPQAALLDLQLRHEAGEWDEADGLIERHLALHPEYAPLKAAASVLAMDLDHVGLARDCALQAADHPDAMVTLGLLELGENHPVEARVRFEKSLAVRSHNPRAKIGLGLSHLAEGHHNEAAEHLDAGAQEFEDHLGSWIAAGWAHALDGQWSIARDRFETALRIDDTFAEAHGSMAVIDLLEGRIDSGRRRTKTALRLDRQSPTAALAGVLLAAGEGDHNKARAILTTALDQPIFPGGRTLLQALASFAR